MLYFCYRWSRRQYLKDKSFKMPTGNRKCIMTLVENTANFPEPLIRYGRGEVNAQHWQCLDYRRGGMSRYWNEPVGWLPLIYHPWRSSIWSLFLTFQKDCCCCSHLVSAVIAAPLRLRVGTQFALEAEWRTAVTTSRSQWDIDRGLIQKVIKTTFIKVNEKKTLKGWQEISFPIANFRSGFRISRRDGTGFRKQ